MLKRAVYFIIWLVITVTAIPAQAQCSKTMAWSDDYPYSFKVNPNTSLPQGINIKKVQAAFSQLNCNLHFSKMPFARALIELELGRVDLIGSAFSLPDRHTYAWYSNVPFNSPNVLFMHNDDLAKFSLKSLEDIKKYQLKLGVQIGVSYSKEYTRLSAEPEFSALIRQNVGRKALWNMLQLRRVDAVIADLSTGLAELKQLGLQDTIGPSQLVISTQASYFIFSKKTTDQGFVDAFDAELMRLEKNGTLGLIEKNYY